MTGNEDFLKEKAKLLIARERELLALRRKHKRVALWLTLAQHLAELVEPSTELPQACARVSERLVAVLDLYRVAFFEVEGGRLRRVTPAEAPAEPPIELEPLAVELLAGAATGMCVESNGDAQAALARAVALHRFLWHRMTPVAGPALLFVAGYDRERAQFYAPFDEDDIAHFENTAHQLALLLANNALVRSLERDNRILQDFGAELERRVDERTRELAAVNRELGQALESLREKDRRLKEDIDEARLFQRTMLAEGSAPSWIDVATRYEPLELVGGDVFDACEVRPGTYCTFLADATGHGVQAAMRTILIKADYDRLKTTHASARSLLEELNQRLVALFPGGEVMCAACCLDVSLDDAGARVVYSNAGNAPLLLWSKGTATPIYGDSPLLGVAASVWPAPRTFRMEPGDVLLVASDGLSEQRNEHGGSFEDVVGLSKAHAAVSAASFVADLLAEFDEFRGTSAVADDLTLIALRLPVRVTNRS